MDRSQEIIRTSWIGIAANVLLAGFKAAVGILASSVAIVMDAVNNLSDALIASSSDALFDAVIPTINATATSVQHNYVRDLSSESCWRLRLISRNSLMQLILILIPCPIFP